MRSRYLVLSAVVITLLLATWLRFYRIDYQSFWNDEGNSLGLAGRDVGTIVRSAAADIHPPGYYLALKGWAALVGTSELALRGFSALAGIVLVALLYRLGKHYFGPAAGVAAALAGAFNPFLIYYAQEARMYALAATLGAASFLLFSAWLRSSRPPAFRGRSHAPHALTSGTGRARPHPPRKNRRRRGWRLSPSPVTRLSAGSARRPRGRAGVGAGRPRMRTPGPASPAGDRRLGLAYCLLTAAGLYTHYAFGFVVLAQNVAALGGLLAHRKGAGAGGLRLAAWIGWQALALLLYLPWLFTALRQLSTWPAAREIQSLGAAVGDLARYLFFGRTLPTAAAWAGLAGTLVLLLFALRRRGQTITPLLWLLVPAALTLGFGLLSEPFAKFLLVAVPAGCLLLGQGLAALPARASQPGQRRSPRRLARELGLLALWLAALGALSGGTYASLNNLYFNPAYFRDDYRGIARYVAGIARPGDALITIAPNQVEALGHYHTSGAPIYPLPHTRPLDPAETETALANIAARHARLFVLYWGDAQADPEHRVEKWLNTHTFKAGDTWYGQVRLATYATATPAAAPSTLSGAQFGQPGQAITLEGYTLPEAALAPGDILQVTLFWRADKPIEERYKVFVHLYTDPNQPPVAQQDSEPGGGLAPTNGWLPGQTIADNHGLLIPADAPPGQYSVSLGLYELFTDVRLPVTLEQAEAGDRLSLGTLTLR